MFSHIFYGQSFVVEIWGCIEFKRLDFRAGFTGFDSQPQWLVLGWPLASYLAFLWFSFFIYENRNNSACSETSIK